ncbi:hypothetical protein SGPA1_40077 [Streptomyces misionensis JCM 4497]
MVPGEHAQLQAHPAGAPGRRTAARRQHPRRRPRPGPPQDRVPRRLRRARAGRADGHADREPLHGRQRPGGAGGHRNRGRRGSTGRHAGDRSRVGVRGGPRPHPERPRALRADAGRLRGRMTVRGFPPYPNAPARPRRRAGSGDAGADRRDRPWATPTASGLHRVQVREARRRQAERGAVHREAQRPVCTRCGNRFTSARSAPS